MSLVTAERKSYNQDPRGGFWAAVIQHDPVFATEYMPRATARGITRVTITTTTTTPEVLSQSGASRAGSRFDWSWVVIGGCVAFTVYVAVIPLGFLFWQSFRTPQTAATPAVWTLGNYAAAYGTSETVRLFWTSIRFASGASLFAFVVGTALAWMNERTNTPFKTVFFALSLIPLVIPSILFTVAWILLASPQIGIVNQLLQGWFGLEQPPFDIYSMAGMIWVDGLHYSPMAFLLMSAAFRAMDPSLEESATMSGASVWQVLWRVTLKLTWPAIFATILILFVRSIESFEVPALLGLPVGIEVFTSSIYTAVHRYPSQVGLASAYGVALLAITTVGVYAVSRLSSKGSKYATVTGKGFRPRQIDLGPCRSSRRAAALASIATSPRSVSTSSRGTATICTRIATSRLPTRITGSRRMKSSGSNGRLAT